jgi:Mg2+ and Co2+ transporter CorA
VAKRDLIILGTTKRDASRLVKAYVGPEFLLITLLHNLQDGFHDAFVKDHDRKMDTISYHEQLTKVLQSRIQRDPRRQRFLEIDRLRANLDAMLHLKDIQAGVLDALETMLSPHSFSYFTTEWKFREARISLIGLESPYLRVQMDDLAAALEKVGALLRRVQNLQSNAQMSLEILEEGHGKAIRVFTIVTLFFLPL